MVRFPLLVVVFHVLCCEVNLPSKHPIYEAILYCSWSTLSVLFWSNFLLPLLICAFSSWSFYTFLCFPSLSRNMEQNKSSLNRMKSLTSLSIAFWPLTFVWYFFHWFIYLFIPSPFSKHLKSNCRNCCCGVLFFSFIGFQVLFLSSLFLLFVRLTTHN